MFTFDVGTDTGKVRLLVPDRDPGEYLFEDAEIAAFLGIEGQDVRCAAALALETIAADTALTLKAVTVLDLTTNGPATAKALLDRAKLLRSQAAEAALKAGTEVTAFGVAEMVLNPAGYTERLWNEGLRE